jgi:hypothetical protein
LGTVKPCFKNAALTAFEAEFSLMMQELDVFQIPEKRSFEGKGAAATQSEPFGRFLSESERSEVSRDAMDELKFCLKEGEKV